MWQQALDQLKDQIAIRSRYDNFIGGDWVAPVKGQYLRARRFAESRDRLPRTSNWRSRPRTRRKMPGADIAQRTRGDPEQDCRPHGGKLPLLALVETLDNGKPIHETAHADMPLAINHFRYFAAGVTDQL